MKGLIFMKKTRLVSFATAGVMALASLPMLSVSAAETTYAQGDVDMDGVITGHDTAMVSRSLYDEAYTLNEEQYALADMNGDGTVDLTDMETLHTQEVYTIGDVKLTGYGVEKVILDDASYVALLIWGLGSAGASIETMKESFDELPPSIYDNDELAYIFIKDVLQMSSETNVQINEVQYNLLDGNADGIVDVIDAYYLLFISSYRHAGGLYIGRPYYLEGRYDLTVPPVIGQSD